MVPEGKTVEFTAKDDDYAVEKLTVTPMDALIAGGKPGENTAKVKIIEATTVKVTFSHLFLEERRIWTMSGFSVMLNNLVWIMLKVYLTRIF